VNADPRLAGSGVWGGHGQGFKAPRCSPPPPQAKHRQREPTTPVPGRPRASAISCQRAKVTPSFLRATERAYFALASRSRGSAPGDMKAGSTEPGATADRTFEKGGVGVGAGKVAVRDAGDAPVVAGRAAKKHSGPAPPPSNATHPQHGDAGRQGGVPEAAQPRVARAAGASAGRRRELRVGPVDDVTFCHPQRAAALLGRGGAKNQAARDGQPAGGRAPRGRGGRSGGGSGGGGAGRAAAAAAAARGALRRGRVPRRRRRRARGGRAGRAARAAAAIVAAAARAARAGGGGERRERRGRRRRRRGQAVRSCRRQFIPSRRFDRQPRRRRQGSPQLLALRALLCLPSLRRRAHVRAGRRGCGGCRCCRGGAARAADARLQGVSVAICLLVRAQGLEHLRRAGKGRDASCQGGQHENGGVKPRCA
jgi:hypothetical protein